MPRIRPVFASCLVLIACGCNATSPAIRGSGVSKTESRVMPDFDEVELMGVGHLNLAIGPLSPLSVTADDNLLPLLHTTVEGRRLVIRPDKSISPKSELVYKITVPNVKKLSVEGANSVALAGIKNDTLALLAKGAATVSASGKTDSLNVQLQGVGSIKASYLVARSVSAQLQGTGSVEVHAAEKLSVQLEGVGTVRYRGDPKIDSKIDGLGRVEKIK